MPIVLDRTDLNIANVSNVSHQSLIYYRVTLNQNTRFEK